MCNPKMWVPTSKEWSAMLTFIRKKKLIIIACPIFFLALVVILWTQHDIPKLPGKTVVLSDSIQPILTLTNFRGPISSVAFSPDSKNLAICDSEGKIRLWNIELGKPIRTFEKSDREGGIAFSSSGKFLMSAWIRVWDAKNGRLLRTFTKHLGEATLEAMIYKGGAYVPAESKIPASVTALTVSTNGKFLAIASNNKTTEIWNAQKGTLCQILRGHTESVDAIAFSPDEHLIASGSADETVKLWDVKTGKLKHTLKGHSESVRAVNFLSDGKTLASVSQNGEVFLWDVSTGKLIRKYKSDNMVPEACFSADGKRLAVSMTEYGLSNQVWGDIWVQDTLTGKILYELETAAPDSFALSSDGKMLAVGGVEYNQKYKNGYRIVVQLWNIK